MNSYSVKFSDPGKRNDPIIVLDGTKNTESTSLTLIGRNYPGFGQSIAEDFVHLLENFSSSIPPSNPIEGQLWFDTSNPNNKKLRINDGGASGTSWTPVNGIYQQSYRPENVKNGDIWIDTANHQLNIYNGTSFTLIGPSIASALETGITPEILTDIGGIDHSVILSKVNGRVIEVISGDEFIPNPVIPGFSTIKAGINLSTSDFGSFGVSAFARLNTAADTAYNLTVNSPSSQTISADAFMRKDISQSIAASLSISTDANSLKIGLDPTFILEKKNQYTARLLNLTDKGKFVFDIANGNRINTVLTIDGSNQTIGINTSNPSSELDVNGSLRVSNTATVSKIFVTSQLSNSNSVSGNAVEVAGGVGVRGTLNAHGVRVFNAPITIGSAGITPPTYTATSLLNPSSDVQYDIGDPAVSWRTVYANVFRSGDSLPTGATFIGNADSASKLSSARSLVFHNLGDIVTNAVTFDGSRNVVFTATVTANLIYSKAQTTATNSTDTLLLYRASMQPDVGQGNLLKQTKSDFLKDINYVQTTTSGTTVHSTPSGSLVPLGTVLPFAGISPPTGWLLCDGTDQPPQAYPELYDLIGNTYGGTFKMPDLTDVTMSKTNNTAINYIIKY